MKKSKFNFKNLYLILATVFAASSFVGCESNTEHRTPSEPNPNIIQPAKDSSGNTIMLTSNNSSLYKIVIPELATAAEESAAENLSKFLLEATGASLMVVTDKGLEYSESNSYISIGHTKLLSKSGIVLDKKVLGEEGVLIETKGNMIFITGAQSDGTLYAVYEFLEKEIGFEVYYTDEIYYRQSSEVPVLAFKNYISVPDFAEGRWVGAGMFDSFDESSLMRLQYGYFDGSFNSEGNIWGAWSHSFPNLGIVRDNYPDNPRWFFGETQVCFSQLDLADEVAKKFIERIPLYPNARYWQIGDGDSNSACNCKDCQDGREANGGVQGGVFMVFLNRVGQRVEEWTKANNIERDITIIGLAYEGTSVPPSRFNEQTQQYEPVNPNVKARANVGVMYAPIADCTHHSVADEGCSDHQTRKDRLYGWAACTDSLSLWLYNTNFRDYFLPLNDWGGIKRDAQIYKEIGVKFIFSQSCKNGRTSFDALRLYLRSKLWWDTELDYNTLQENFFANYYKSAAKEMKEYFDSIQAHYVNLYGTVSGNKAQAGCGNCFEAPTYYGPGNWSYQYLLQNKELLQKAFHAVQNSSESRKVKEQLSERIRIEELHIDGYLWNYYSAFYSREQYNELQDAFLSDCEKFGIKYWAESTLLLKK